MPSRARPPSFHAVAWLVWAVAVAACVQLAPNPVYVMLVVGVAGVVVATHGIDSPLARSFPVLLGVGVVFALLRVVLTGLTAHGSGAVLVRLPEATLPQLLGGFTIGGPVSAAVVLHAASEGLAIVGIMAAFGAFNAVVSHHELVQSAPRAFYEPGLIVTVGLAFVPSTLAAITAVREADQARTGGRAVRRGRVTRLILPVLESGMERAVALAESMDSRGFGRAAPTAGERVGAWAGLGALCALAASFVALVARQQTVAALVGVAGAVLLVGAVVVTSRASGRPRYRRRPMVGADRVVVAASLLAPAGLALLAAAGDRSLVWTTAPLGLPRVSPLALVALAPLLLPGVWRPVGRR